MGVIASEKKKKCLLHFFSRETLEKKQFSDMHGEPSITIYL